MKKDERQAAYNNLIAKSPLAKSPLAKGPLANAFPGQDVAADPDPEEQKAEPEKKNRRIRKIDLEDKYSRQTYWIRKEYIQKVQDYAFTEDINLRQAINRLLLIAFDEVDRRYQEEGKELLHYDEKEGYEYDYL